MRKAFLHSRKAFAGLAVAFVVTGVPVQSAPAQNSQPNQAKTTAKAKTENGAGRALATKPAPKPVSRNPVTLAPEQSQPDVMPVLFTEDEIEKIAAKHESTLSPKELNDSLSDSSAFPAAKTAILAAEKGDFQTVLELTDPLLIEKVGKDKILRTLTKLRLKARERGGFLQIRFNSETSVQEGVSTIGLDLYFGDGSRDTKTVRLRQTEDKKWVVTG